LLPGETAADLRVDIIPFASAKIGAVGILERTMNPTTEKRNLEQTLQALYDSEINVTITMLWDGGVDFALISYMEYDESTPDDWHLVRSFAELADALHRLALKTYPESDYAKKYGDGKVLPIR
jgi:hypothetical protein